MLAPMKAERRKHPLKIPPNFQRVCTTAMKCRWCFKQLPLEAPTIDIAQPRWIGRTYWSARPRVLVLMLNPGSGDSRSDKADDEAVHLLRCFAKTKTDSGLRKIFEHFKQDSENWGRGHFRRFYSEYLGLGFEDIAFANVAWCSTRGNHYPVEMLERCFSQHTQEILRVLMPQVVLLSGSATYRFADRIKKLLPGTAIIKMLHFAHREGRDAEERQAKKIRRQVESLKVSGGD